MTRRWHELPAIYWPTRNGKFIRMVSKPGGGYEVEEPQLRLRTLEEFDFGSAEMSLLEQYTRARAKP